MKVKNIAFSGFAAAILSGVGVADAAVQIVSPDYVSKAIAGKQNTLTDENAGAGIAIENGVISADMANATVSIDGQDVSVSDALAGAASDAADAKSDAATALEAAGNAASTASAANTTADEAKTAAGNAAAKADGAASDAAAALEAAQTATSTANTASETANRAKETAESAAAAVENKANASDVYTKGETDNLLNGKQNAFELGSNLELVDGVLNTKGIATDATFTELEGEVDDLKIQVGEGSVADRISAAVTEAKGYTDNAIDGLSNVYAAKSYEATVDGLTSTVATNTQNIATNTNDIAAMKAAGYIPAPATDGMWLANVNGESVSWEQVEILSQP